MTVIEKTFNLFAEGTDKIELPTSTYRCLVSLGLDMLHCELEKPTSNEYIKLVADCAVTTDNPEGIIYAFFQPARMKNVVEQPMQPRYFDLRPTYERRTIRLITEKENKVKRMMIRIDTEIYEN